MNKRARTRLIGVTAIIIIVIVAILVGTKSKAAAYQTITQVSQGGVKAGDRVKVGGAVVAGSWNKQSNPMVFSIREENDTAGTGPTLKVSYSGAAPNTFGDGVVAIVTGTLNDKGMVQANEMITKCPSKYQSATGAIPVAELGKGTSMVGVKDIQVTGYVKAGSMQGANSADRLIIAEKADGSGKSFAVGYTGALPNGIKDGSQIVITGTLQQSGSIAATNIALAQGQ